jgi:hypothetical protein
MAQQLVPGDQFQNYTVQITGGRALDIPSDLKGEYANELHHRLGKKSDSSLLCDGPYRKNRRRRHAQLDLSGGKKNAVSNEIVPSQKGLLKRNLESPPHNFADNSQSLLDTDLVHVQMSHHAHSARVHGTTEHMALRQLF